MLAHWLLHFSTGIPNYNHGPANTISPFDSLVSCLILLFTCLQPLQRRPSYTPIENGKVIARSARHDPGYLETIRRPTIPLVVVVLELRHCVVSRDHGDASCSVFSLP